MEEREMEEYESTMGYSVIKSRLDYTLAMNAFSLFVMRVRLNASGHVQVEPPFC